MQGLLAKTNYISFFFHPLATYEEKIKEISVRCSMVILNEDNFFTFHSFRKLSQNLSHVLQEDDIYFLKNKQVYGSVK